MSSNFPISQYCSLDKFKTCKLRVNQREKKANSEIGITKGKSSHR